MKTIYMKSQKTAQLSDTERERYERQLRIDGFGEAGQQRLKGASVLVSRAGGVGGTAAVNLALAGIGRIILVHGGEVQWDYMNRLAWATPDDLGKPCCEVLAAHIRRINPEVEVSAVDANISGDNVAELVAGSDIIIDGAPLFEERYLMHGEAVRQKKPIVMGAVYGTEGVRHHLRARRGALPHMYLSRQARLLDQHQGIPGHRTRTTHGGIHVRHGGHEGAERLRQAAHGRALVYRYRNWPDASLQRPAPSRLRSMRRLSQ